LLSHEDDAGDDEFKESSITADRGVNEEAGEAGEMEVFYVPLMMIALMAMRD
jgi:hypothetical protein